MAKIKAENTVQQICINCCEWESDDNKKGECIKLDKDTESGDFCSYYSPDPSRFCCICNSKATDDESCAAIVCNESDLHYASHWDYEWYSI